MKKVLICIALILGFVAFGLLPTYAYETELPTPESYVQELTDALPEEVKSQLPLGTTYEEMAQNTNSSFLLSLSISFLKESLYSVYTHLDRKSVV